MTTPIFQIDAFTRERFHGNPAAVIPLPAFLSDAALQAIALENNLAETAFIVREGADWRLRWFTPTVEVPLCGHATLASAWVVMNRLEPASQRVAFDTLSGELVVRRDGDGFAMDFPARISTRVAPMPALAAAIGEEPLEVLHDGTNLIAVLDSAAKVRGLAPDLRAIAALPDVFGVIVTAPGDEGYDIVSRYFAPAKGVDEDPVTGSAHCGLTPYWSVRLGKPDVLAYQASARGGEIRCRANGERVELRGTCVPYLEGTIEF